MHILKQILIILFILLFSNLAFSQVVIKDTVVITPKDNGKSSPLSISNPQYYIATISISCDALNSTHDPTYSRGAIVFQIGTSTVQLAGALNPGDLGRTGSIVYPSSPVTIDAAVQLSIGGTQCPLTPDSPLSYVIIIDSISVGSIVYQATYPFPTVQVMYPLQAQDIYGVTTIHGEAQVDPSPDSSAAVTWTVYDDNGDQRSNQTADINITGYNGVAYIKATATNKYGSTDSDPVQIWIDPMNTPAGNNIYTQYGGVLTVGINGVDPSFYDSTQAMQLMLNSVPLLSSSVPEAQVSVGQWSTLDFNLLKKGYQHAPGFNLQLMQTYGFAEFDETDYYTLYSFYLSLTIDSTQQTLPPDWVYGDPFFLEDPFVPSQTLFIAPVTGKLMLQITGASTAAIDTLFLQSPVKKFLLINPSGNIGDTLDCGVVTAGDTIQFYLRSSMGIVAGRNMYPEITLPDTGGVIASIAAKGRQTGGVSPVDKRKLLLKSHGVDQSLQKRLFTEKIKSRLTRNPSSTSQVVHLQQKNVQTQGAKKSVSNPDIIIGPGNPNPVTTLAFEDWTDLDFDDLQAGAWISTAGWVDHFVVNVGSDTLSNRQIAPLTVVAVDSNGHEVSLAGSTPINILFDQGQEYLDFITLLNDTVNVPQTFSYDTLRLGLIKVIARGESSGPVLASAKSQLHIKAKTSSVTAQGYQNIKAKTSSVTAQGYQTGFPIAIVKAGMSADATKVGTRNVFLPPEIKVIVVADSIQPYDSSYIPVNESQTSVKVAVTVSGILYADPLYQVTVTSAALEGSGEHSHTGNRPSGLFITSGNPVSSQEFDTGPDTIRTTYQASMFGGQERVIAKLNLPMIADSDSVVVRVPALVQFHGAGNYILPPNPDTHHPANYYLLQGAIDDLIAAANEFQNAEWNTTGTMTLNDMSLQLGGLFDINSNWTPPHNLHRLGKSVDIQNIIKKDTTGTFTIHNEQKTGTYKVANVDWLNRFAKLMNRHGWTFIEEPGQYSPNTTPKHPEGSVPYPHFDWSGN